MTLKSTGIAKQLSSNKTFPFVPIADMTYIHM